MLHKCVYKSGARSELKINNFDTSPLLTHFKKEHSLIDEKLFRRDCRHAFFMAAAKVQKPESKTPPAAAILFNNPLRERNLTDVIFDFAGIKEPTEKTSTVSPLL